MAGTKKTGPSGDPKGRLVYRRGAPEEWRAVICIVADGTFELWYGFQKGRVDAAAMVVRGGDGTRWVFAGTFAMVKAAAKTALLHGKKLHDPLVPDEDTVSRLLTQKTRGFAVPDCFTEAVDEAAVAMRGKGKPGCSTCPYLNECGPEETGWKPADLLPGGPMPAQPVGESPEDLVRLVQKATRERWGG